MLRFIIACAIPFLLSVSSVKNDGESVWDLGNSKQRKAAHKYLFEEYAKKNKSVFSAVGKRLEEVVVFDKPTSFSESLKVPLPEGTQRVASMFDQVVVRGENLESLKVALSFERSGKYLRRYRGTDSNLAVFELPKLPRKLSRKQFEGSKKPSPLSLEISCRKDAGSMVRQIALRHIKGLESDFESHQQSLFSFTNDDWEMQMKFLVQTRKRDVKDIASSLNESTDEFNRIVHFASLGPSVGNFPIKGVLADRRVAKLFENLSRLDSEIAAMAATTWFDKSFDTYKSKWENSTIVQSSEIYSPHAHIFLCSEFCSPDVTLEKLDEWNSWHAEKSTGAIQFEKTGNVDKLFEMNLQLNILQRKNDWSIDQLNTFLAEAIGANGKPPTLEYSPFHASDWTSKQPDLLAFIPTFSRTSGLIDPSKQQLVFEILRSEILKAP